MLPLQFKIFLTLNNLIADIVSSDSEIRNTFPNLQMNKCEIKNKQRTGD